jgi:hypothetical protein
MYGGIEMNIHVVFTSGLNFNEGQVHAQAALPPKKESPVYMIVKRKVSIPARYRIPTVS